MREPTHNEIVAARQWARLGNRRMWSELLARYPEWAETDAADVWADDSLHYDTPTA